MTASVTLFIMARNEERCIRRCIDSSAAFVDEVLVLDTGSTDETVAISKSSGAKVIHRVWDDNFAASRNFGLSHVGTDYVFSLDADEWLIQGQQELEIIRGSMFEDLVFEVGMIMGAAGETYSLSSNVIGTFFTPRIFPRNRFYRGRVHEVLNNASPLRRTALRVQHDGYEPAQKSRKTGRNLKLLKMSLLEDTSNPLTHYYYAKELRADLENTTTPISPQNLATIAEHFLTSLRSLPPNSTQREVITRELLLFYRDYKCHSDGIKLILGALQDKAMSKELSYISAVFLYECALEKSELPYELAINAADGLFFRLLKEIDEPSATYAYHLDMNHLRKLRNATTQGKPSDQRDD